MRVGHGGSVTTNTTESRIQSRVRWRNFRTENLTVMASERVLFGVSALLFAASATVTVVWCVHMSRMGQIPTVSRLESTGQLLASGSPPPKKNSPSQNQPVSSDVDFEARYVPGATVAERYRMVALLGKGGMGEVYRAEDLKLGQTVALKFLPGSVVHNEAARTRFHREVRLARQVSHPNVCRVFDIGEAGGRTFITMEYVDGEDLAFLLRRIGRLPPDKALEIARQMRWACRCA
jgi:Protein kinase domain